MLEHIGLLSFLRANVAGILKKIHVINMLCDKVRLNLSNLSFYSYKI